MSLFELRSYLCRPGQRDTLIDMFEDVFLDAYEAGGTRVLGTFRSLDEPDRWVWIRGFEDVRSRGAALAKFYGGANWRAHADACDATIAQISEALLLREPRPGLLGTLKAPPPGSTPPSCVYVMAIHALPPGAEDGFAAELGATAVLVSDHSENTYPRQPVRAGSFGVVLTRYASAKEVPDPRAGEVMRLAPSARSALR